MDGKTGYYLETSGSGDWVSRHFGCATGPACRECARDFLKEGTNPPESLPADSLATAKDSEPAGDQTSTGMEKITTPAGDMETGISPFHRAC